MTADMEKGTRCLVPDSAEAGFITLGNEIGEAEAEGVYGAACRKLFAERSVAFMPLCTH